MNQLHILIEMIQAQLPALKKHIDLKECIETKITHIVGRGGKWLRDAVETPNFVDHAVNDTFRAGYN